MSERPHKTPARSQQGTKPNLFIRPLHSDADYQACLELQYQTWGHGFREAVPPSIMLVSQKLGGVAAGAFDVRGRMLGFVFGITGVRGGEIVHWSDMLAVSKDAQNAGIGRQLKDYQRRAVAAVGAKSVRWTFDPLMERNAHLNFNVFGARAVEYVANMYGDSTGSDLHRGIGTDRLVMEWPVDDEELARARSTAAAARVSESYQAAPEIGDPSQPAGLPGGMEHVSHLRIVIPRDLASLLQSDPRSAVEWRSRNRFAFQGALGKGFRVEGFARSDGKRPGAYLLAR